MLILFKRTKFITVQIAALLAIAVLSFSAFAGEARINFSDPSVTAGDNVNVHMTVTADDGTPLGNADIVLSYPSEKIQFVSGTDADGGAGTVRVHGTSIGGGSALLEYNLTFSTISAGTASVNVESYEVYDTEDNKVDITHLGSSSISINAGDSESSDSALSFLEVYPGELSPEFSADTDTYAVTVGLGVERLTINAVPNDSSASVTINGNESLPDGDSSVQIVVSAADGVSSKTYTVNVSKVEGGPESIIGEGSATVPEEGVQLSTKGKTITILPLGEGVEVPEGLTEGTIKIGEQRVTGWVLNLDETPEYCVVYGMNDDGEVNFYRYDLAERTIQRFFEDPLNEGAVTQDEYNQLAGELNDALDASEFRMIIIFVLAALCFLLLVVAVYLGMRLSAERTRAAGQRAKEMKARRRMRSEAEADHDQDEPYQADNELDNIRLPEDDYSDSQASGESDPANEHLDETHVIRRAERRRRKRKSTFSEENEDLSMSSLDEIRDEAPESAGTDVSPDAESAEAYDDTHEQTDIDLPGDETKDLTRDPDETGNIEND